MRVTSNTGLLESRKKKLSFPHKKTDVQLKAITGPAPFVLKPFAGIYNPYPYGCSLLCNHPTDSDAKELLRRAKDTWANEGRSLLLAEEVAAIRAGLEKLQTIDNDASRRVSHFIPVESVPEELFRRYTDTDSRPLTPAPTLASTHTRASGSRRCVTPDPIQTSEIREKTLLILDLRRSHSQETLSYQGSSILQEPPTIKIQRVETRSTTPELRSTSHTPDTLKKKNERSTPSPSQGKRPKSAKPEVKPMQLQVIPQIEEDFKDEQGEEEDELDRRRGKKRRKRGRDFSRGPPAFQSSIDPETQVATIGLDSHNPSARPSLVPTSAGHDVVEPIEEPPVLQTQSSLDIDSFLDKEILKQLRRELDEEVIDNEFNIKRKLALKEALKTVPKQKIYCSELLSVQKEMKLSEPDIDFFLSLPRVFCRSSARFELPMDSRALSKMTPMEYIKEYVNISNARKLLYNHVFNKHKIEYEEIDGVEREYDRKIAGGEIPNALNTMMGKPLTEKQLNSFRNLVGWSDKEEYDFKIFCGMCALCERLLAPEFCPQLPSKKADPCHEIETVDFEALPRKLAGQKVDERLVKILNGLKEN